MINWISIAKNPPKIHQQVILTDGYVVGSGYLTTQDSWYVHEEDLAHQHFKYWIPFPEFLDDQAIVTKWGTRFIE